MKKTMLVVMIAALLATFACYMRQESVLDRQIRLVEGQVASHGYTIDDCGE